MFILGLGLFNDDWHTAFYVPTFFALLVAIFIWFTLRDTHQSCGLSAIEKFKNDYPENYNVSNEKDQLQKAEPSAYIPKVNSTYDVKVL